MDIQRTGIRGLSRKDIDEAGSKGKCIKLLCRGRVENGKATGIVSPCLIDKDDLLASINGTATCATITTDLWGPISIIEHEHTVKIDQTAYGVIGDLFRILKETC